MDGRYRNVSLCLYQVLDWIGASDEMRGIYREKAILEEIVSTAFIPVISGKHYINSYLFGSYFEGTTTLGLNSDKDVLAGYNYLVVERIYDAPLKGTGMLMVTDDTTKPGYVKLHVVTDRVVQTINHRETKLGEQTDHLGRICFKHLADLVHPSFIQLFYNERNGPAMTSTLNNCAIIDDVQALRITFIPSVARLWFSRMRMYNWPKPEQIDYLKHYGCFLVGVNHPSSKNGPIEWRLSFSLQERFLMTSLNPTQHKCYILLKMIKKDIINKTVQKSISSYHCKTCLFYTIENTLTSFWTPNKLLECLLLCIRQLLQWVNEENCPNYFIPNENMFDKLGYTTLKRVQTVLEDMVAHWCRFIWSITCDDVGNMLFEVLCGSGITRTRNECTTREIEISYLKMWDQLQGTLKRLLWLSSCRSYSDILTTLQVFNSALTETDIHVVREYSVEETRIASTYMRPYISLEIAQCLASFLLTIRDDGQKRTVFDKFVYFIKKSKDSDVSSTYLIAASYFLQSSRFDTCEKFLLQCETSLKHHVVSMCSCRPVQVSSDDAMKPISRLIHKKALSPKQFIRNCVTGCIRFLPCEANLVTQALHLEMYRSFNTSPHYSEWLTESWFDSIVVDSKVYLYFMQYVLFSKTNKPVNKQDAIDNTVRVIVTNINLGHKETAYNLLGWIYSQENKINEALKCFLTSWRIRPNHNAAKWHVLLLIYHTSTHRNVSNYYGINTH